MKAWRAVLGLAVPVLLLGAGWLVSSLRERDARLAEEHSAIDSALARACSAIDAGLRELVTREDERPFYVYSHYYSPPDVLSLNDPVALSPLASEARDPRIVGYFELDPDGTIRTPYSTDPGATTDRARRVIDALDDDARRALQGELGAASAGALIAMAPTGPTNPLAQVGNFLATDITQAQSGDVEAYNRVQQRGRAVPRVARRDVPNLPQQAERQDTQQIVTPEPAPALPPLVQGEIEVDYTPMTLHVLDGALVLTRIVSNGGSRVLDGVVLDRARIVESWVPETIARAVPTDAPIVVTPSTSSDACAARRAASELLPDVTLCAPVAPLRAVERSLDATLRIELAILVLLLSLAGLAAWLILRTSRRAAELARQKSAFVTAVSHELRTPLTTLRMHAEMLDEGLVPEERRSKVHAELVSESVRLARLVENVLEISRLEEGRRPLRATRADLGKHVARIVGERASTAASKGFTLESSDLPEIEASFDPDAIEQIVTNAIDNALKYASTASERRVEITLVRVAMNGRPGVEIRVRDHGPGIEPKERERVFERFYRVERVETAHQPGTGLGLALVRELARAHGGSARIEDGQPGTLLVVWLPLM